MNIRNLGRKGLMTAMVASSMLIGTVGGLALNAIQVGAQTVTTTQNATPAATAGPSTGSQVERGVPGGKFHSNEDPTHEANESPEREAEENAGQRPTVK